MTTRGVWGTPDGVSHCTFALAVGQASSTGALRTPNDDGLSGRNSNDNGDIPIITLDSNDVIQIGGGGQTAIQLRDGAGNVVVKVESTSELGFYGVACVARPAAYTQTYSTATRTHSNPTGATLTDSSGGTADQTVANPPDPADTPASADALRDDLVANTLPVIRNNFADVTDEINKLIADVANVKQVLNQVIDDLQANGLLQ